MLRRVSALAALGVLVSAPASAGVLLTYPTPPSGDAFYAAQSVVAGEAVLGVGWIDAARTAPRPAALDARGEDAPVWAVASEGGATRLFNPAEAAFGGATYLHKRLHQSAVGIFGGAELGSLSGEGLPDADATLVFGGGVSLVPEEAGTTLVRRIWEYFLDPEPGTPVDIVWLSAVSGSGTTGGVGSDVPPTLGMAELTSHLGPPDSARQTLDKPELIDF